MSAEFVAWVNTHNGFRNTLVDRIVPGFPAAKADALFADLGYQDPRRVAAEPILLWVIKGPAHNADALPPHKAGLDTVLEMTEDPVVSKYLKQVI